MSDIRDRSALMADHQGLVRALAWRIKKLLPNTVEIDDLVGFGMVGLAEAAHAFDPAKGNHFTTFAFYRVRGAILDSLRKQSWFSAAAYEGRLYEAAQTPPEADDQPAQEPPKPSRAGRPRRTSLDDADDAPYRGSAPSVRTPEAAAAHIEMRTRLRENLTDLPDDAFELLRSVYFEGVSLATAARNMGVSRSWACRLHGRALAALASNLSTSPIQDSEDA